MLSYNNLHPKVEHQLDLFKHLLLAVRIAATVMWARIWMPYQINLWKCLWAWSFWRSGDYKLLLQLWSCGGIACLLWCAVPTTWPWLSAELLRIAIAPAQFQFQLTKLIWDQGFQHTSALFKYNSCSSWQSPGMWGIFNMQAMLHYASYPQGKYSLQYSIASNFT